MNEELRELRRKNNNKNYETFQQIKKLNTKKKEFFNEVNEVKAEKDKLMNKINHLKDEKAKLAKNGYQGKTWKKQKLLNMIQQKEQEFRNSRKTAVEEKQMMEVIKKMKASLKHVPKMEKTND